jgi:hypothetical protein
MEEVEELFNEFSDAELKAYLARPDPDFKEFNKYLAAMDSFCVDSLKTTFGLMYISEPYPEDIYKALKQSAPPQKQTLFLVRKYNTRKFGLVYRGYLNDINGFLTYIDSLFVREIDEKFMIFSKFTFGYGRSGNRKKHWFFSGGEELKESDLKKPIETYRLTEPSTCEECKEDYYAD